MRLLMVIVLLNLLSLNLLVIYISNLKVCSFDVGKAIQHFSEVSYSQDRAKEVVKLIKEEINKSGCFVVFSKGALLKADFVKDITPEVLRNVSEKLSRKK